MAGTAAGEASGPGAGGSRGPLWIDGRLTLRVRGPGPEPGRVVRLRKPFALVGRLPGADLRIDDPGVDDRHALLILDRRGVFGVDLLSRAGTRFAGAPAGSARLGAGDILEVAGRRIEILELRVGGRVVSPPLSDDDLLDEAGAAGLAALTLQPEGGDGPPWRLGSALAFAGRGEACAIRVEGDLASETHCALLRCVDSAYVIDLHGRRTLLNGRPVEGASALLDGDVLTLGSSPFVVHVGLTAAGLPALLDGPGPIAPGDLAGTLRQFQADAAALFEVQMGRIESLGREIATLREQLRNQGGPAALPAEPFRLELPPRAPSESVASAAWLLDRINGLEAESRSTWKDLARRIATGLRPRTPPDSPPS